MICNAFLLRGGQSLSPLLWPHSDPCVYCYAWHCILAVSCGHPTGAFTGHSRHHRCRGHRTLCNNTSLQQQTANAALMPTYATCMQHMLDSHVPTLLRAYTSGHAVCHCMTDDLPLSCRGESDTNDNTECKPQERSSPYAHICTVLRFHQ